MSSSTMSEDQHWLRLKFFILLAFRIPRYPDNRKLLLPFVKHLYKIPYLRLNLFPLSLRGRAFDDACPGVKRKFIVVDQGRTDRDGEFAFVVTNVSDRPGVPAPIEGFNLSDRAQNLFGGATGDRRRGMKPRDDPIIGNFIAQRSMKSRDQMLSAFKLNKTRLRLRADIR